MRIPANPVTRSGVFRNGYRERRWDTRVGTIDLAIPRVRDGRVTELETGARFAYRPVSGPLRTHNVGRFESEAGGTLVTLTDEIELSGIFGLSEPLMGRMVRRQYEANLGRLKAILEAQPARGA